MKTCENDSAKVLFPWLFDQQFGKRYNANVQFITGQKVVNQGRKLLQIVVAAWEKKIIAFVAQSGQFKSVLTLPLKYDF